MICVAVQRDAVLIAWSAAVVVLCCQIRVTLGSIKYQMSKLSLSDTADPKDGAERRDGRGRVRRTFLRKVQGGCSLVLPSKSCRI